MSIFQKSIVNKYLKTLDNEKVNLAFNEFQRFYGDKLRLFDIVHLKEENYQEGFLREIFVHSLSYTIRPDLNYNLTTEYKNQTDSKKADGAIIKNNSALAVIELKSAKTFNLDNIKNQAFNYKHNQPNCRYVITSNFHHLRFYIDNSTEYEEFDLFEMADSTDNACIVSTSNVSTTSIVSSEFKKFYLILSQESIFNDIPLKMKEETKYQEETITEKFYRDYKAFKDKIFENFVKNNQQFDKLTLFKKSQKLLDRFLFVYFAEDSGLCPPNSVQKIIDKWKRLIDDDIKTTLYKEFQNLFKYLNEGYKGKHFEFQAYNGGLFKPDNLLDNENVTIDDAILLEHCPKLSAYDFNTDIDVNILGHIFEHSLNEIEEITAELKGEITEKSKTKRKKDGIFYTPKYITNYIVENTIGKLCKDKQEELNLFGFQNLTGLYKDKNGKITKQGKNLYIKYLEYKNWLFSLKILDPACGSGAFLNAALDFLIKEHLQIDDLISNLTGDKIPLFDTDKNILERNIFGVDINEESVEIAKLSLWLRTAKKDRKLSDLNDNIKCGNSLIDNKEIAGEKAFDWKTEFAEIMQNGGFDVVIGNPPYVGVKQQTKSTRDFISNNYKYSAGTDLYVAFIEKNIELLKSNCFLGLICPNKFFGADYGKKIRNYIQNELDIYEIWDLKDEKVFEDALISTIVICIQKNKSINNKTFVRNKNGLTELPIFDNNGKVQIEQNNEIKIIINKLDNNLKLKDIADIRTGVMGFEYWKMKDIVNNINNQKYVKLYTNGNIKRYSDLWEFKEIDLYKEKYKQPVISLDTNYLNKNTIDLFCTFPKIIVKGVANQISAIIDYEGAGLLVAVHSILPKNKNDLFYILSVINSKLINWYHLKVFYSIRIPEGSLKYPISFFENIPIFKLTDEQKEPFYEKADIMLSLNKELQLKKDKFIKHIKSNFVSINVNTKISDFYEHDFQTFLTEIKKQKFTLKLAEQDEWEEYFDNYKKEIKELQYQINRTDKEIDKMIYEIYKLTAEEIQIIEN